jgi:hypothetical protein
MQVQNSKYVKIDDDFVNQAAQVEKDIEDNGGNLNKYQKEQKLFDALGEI